ncbi:MAG: hypothetical protein ABSG13_25850 [Bryobacteraceae bacterium]
MKISRPDSASTSQLARPAAAPAWEASASKQPVQPSAASDRAQLSSVSSYLASALSGSPAQVAKVSELSAAVSGGRYQVEAYAVSGSIIRHTIDFGGAGYLAVTR